MATNIQSTALDFNSIKDQLKTYFESQSEFADYDFEASGLSNILDVLAYNTHFNGLIANFALNESFLTTAQLRSSVLSLSQTLGYYPRSKTASIGLINASVTINTVPRPSSLTLPTGTKFSGTINDVTYTFQTIRDYTATDNGGTYQFADEAGNIEIEIHEGQEKTKTFIVDDTNYPVYVIPDVNMDTSTAIVRVYDRGSSNFTNYTSLLLAEEIKPSSAYYTLRESPNGFYEINFGDGSSTGIAPQLGQIIQVTYLSTNGDEANRTGNFTPIDNITVNNVDYSLNVTTSSISAGGDDAETIESIKSNAPLIYASQNRLVTAEDYIGLITSTYGSYFEDVNAWGGQDNSPRDFGNVYVSLKFKDSVPVSTQESVKSRIRDVLSASKSIMSIGTKFLEPDITFIELGTNFNFNPSLTNISAETMQSNIKTLMEDYFETNLNKFNKVFRRSLLLADIDDYSSAILNSRMEVKIQRRFTPSLGLSESYNIFFPVALSNPSSTEYIIQSENFTFNGQTAYIRNKLSTNILQIVSLDEIVLNSNCGSYDPGAGELNLQGVNVQSLIGGSNFIKVTALPSNQSTVRPLRNSILELDLDKSFARALIDYEEIRASL